MNKVVIYVSTDKETDGCFVLGGFSYLETLPAENDAACPHLGNWLCMYLNKNKWGREELLLIRVRG